MKNVYIIPIISLFSINVLALLPFPSDPEATKKLESVADGMIENHLKFNQAIKALNDQELYKLVDNFGYELARFKKRISFPLTAEYIPGRQKTIELGVDPKENDAEEWSKKIENFLQNVEKKIGEKYRGQPIVGRFFNLKEEMSNAIKIVLNLANRERQPLYKALAKAKSDTNNLLQQVENISGRSIESKDKTSLMKALTDLQTELREFLTDMSKEESNNYVSKIQSILNSIDSEIKRINAITTSSIIKDIANDLKTFKDNINTLLTEIKRS